MARNHFALERPRKISIVIPGYDGNAQIKAQTQRQANQKARTLKADQVARQEKTAEVVQKAMVDDASAQDDLEQINQATTHSKGQDVMSELMAAFDLPSAGSKASEGGA